jgi:putative endonuclease
VDTATINLISEGGQRWFHYVLESETHRTAKGKPLRYSGISTDIERRLRQHNAGKGAKCTRGRGPWRVIASCYAGSNRSTALRTEAYFRQLYPADKASWLQEHRYVPPTKEGEAIPR